MREFQAWQWRVDLDWEPKPRVERFTRTLDGDLILWDALVFPMLGQQASHVLLRDVETGEVFCVCDSDGDPVQARLSKSSEAWSVRMVCADALNNAKITRLFFLGEGGQLRERGEPARQIVAIRANGTGLWNTWPEAKHRRSPFRLFDDEGLGAFFRRPAMQVWDALKVALKDPQSDASFAREWFMKTDEQREAMVWNWSANARGRLRAELEEWLHCVLLCDDSLWAKDDNWSLSVPDSDTIWLYTEDFWNEQPLSDQLKKAVGQLWHHYAPFNSEVLKHDCAYAWKQNTIQPFQAEASEPTAHERLEAMLRWRDWKDEHGE